MHKRLILSFALAASCTRQTPVQALHESFPRLAEQILASSTQGPIDLAVQSDGRFSLRDGSLSIRVREDAPTASAFWAATAQGQEEWLLAEVPLDGVAARWVIERGVLREENGRFMVCDEWGASCLEVTAPLAYLSPERPVPVYLTAEGQVLAVHVDAAAGQRALVDPEWKHATPLLISRRRLAAVLLPDGRVLAAGGTEQAVVGTQVVESTLDTAEIYDPLTAKWSAATNAMRFARENVSAITLPNGLVLICGGSGGVTYSELFDPATDSFDRISLASQAQHTDHVLSLLPDGTVLVTGGSAEIYNPASNTWSPLPNQPANPHTAGIVQPLGPLDGPFQVVVAVGLNGGTFVSAAETYDPINQTWSPAARVPATGNVFKSYSGVGGRFADGTIVIHSGAGAAAGTALSNLTASSWTQPMSYPLTLDGVNGTGGMLPNGSFLFCDGATGPYTQGPDCEIAASPTATVKDKVDTNTGFSDWMASSSAVLMPNGRVLIVGGIYNNIDRNGLKTVGLIDPAVPFSTDGGTLPLGVAGQSATLLPSGAVLFAGGATSGGTPAPASQRYSNGNAVAVASLAIGRIGHTGTLLDDGRVLVVGGQTSAGISSTTELFDPATNTWSAGPSLTTARAYHTATALPGGTVVVAGGLGVDGGALKSAERYEWVDGGWAWGSGGTFQGAARSNHVAALMANGRVLVASGRLGATALNSTEQYDPQTNTWASIPKALPVAVYDATATLLPSGGVLVVGGTVTSPSVSETNSVAVFDGPTVGWRTLPNLPHARSRHAAVVMTNNHVLVAGGALSSTGAVRELDVFDPETESWLTIGQSVKGHENATATLLPSGQVIVAGGSTPIGNNETNVELVDEGRGAVAGSVPSLDPVTSAGPTLPGAVLALTGSRFAGLNLGMGGIRGSAPSNLPLISLERQGNEQRFFARISSWTSTSTLARVPTQAPAGWYWLRATVNGVTGPAQPLFIGVVFDAGTSAPDAGASDAGAVTDAGGAFIDAGSGDAGSSELDAGTTDAGTTDAGTPDASTPDSGLRDSGPEVADAGSRSDAGTGPGGSNDAGPGADGGVAPGPGLYGCVCGSGDASGSSLALFGAVILIIAARRRSSVGLLTALVLVLGPVMAEAGSAKAKAKTTNAKPVEAPKAAAPTPEEKPQATAAPATSPAVAPPAVPPAQTKQVKGRIKVAVLPLEAGPGVQKELAEVITDAIASALAAHKELEITSSRDVSARLGFERQRQLLGASTCSEGNLQCMIEIGNALGVDKIAFGSVARLGNSAVLSTTVVELAGSDVVRHTERVRNISEEAFLDAIPPTVEALFPSMPEASARASEPAGDLATSRSSDLNGTRLGVTLRGQMAPLNLPLGALVVHADWSFTESFSAGLGLLVAKPLGVMARATLVPFNGSGRLRPLVSLEVPVIFSDGAPAVGVGAALGVELRIVRNFAVGLEVPVSYYFGGPPTIQRFWLFGAVMLTGRI